ALTTLEAGVRRALGRARVDLWVSRTGFGSRNGPTGGLADTAQPDTLVRRGGVTDYVELGSRAALRVSRYEVGLSLTQRMGSAPIRRTGWELSGTWWLAPNFGIVGSTGHSLPQFGFTVPGARYGTVGLRFAIGGRSPIQRARGTDAEAKSSNRPMLLVAGRKLTIGWAPARTAEVMGDFTDWKSQPLVPTNGGRWTLPAALSPGVHYLNVRFDGGAWLVPSGAFKVDDGFGGVAGMIVVR
ncbi:MAG TPA: glycogen-binding domain-containing protein, partial [Gemmatimonadales bacterium]